MPLKTLSRRKFLALAGLDTGLGVAACDQNPPVIPAVVPTHMPGMETGAPTPAGSSVEVMDAQHKQGVDTCVANVGKNKTFSRQPSDVTIDGVPYITRDPIKPGASFNYEFTVVNRGSQR